MQVKVGTMDYLGTQNNETGILFQLFAYMDDRNTTPAQGLRLAALTSLSWLKDRLGDKALGALDDIPGPDEYPEVDDGAFRPVHIDQGCVADVFPDLPHGIWCLHLSEFVQRAQSDGQQDGRDGGRKETAALILETDIAFRVTGKRLECGFRVRYISECDADIKEIPAMPDVVPMLAANPHFGLRQKKDKMDGKLHVVTSVDEMRGIMKEMCDGTRELPIVVFMPVPPQAAAMPAFPAIQPVPNVFSKSGPPDFFNRSVPMPMFAKTPNPNEQPYDMRGFARAHQFYCRAYFAALPVSSSVVCKSRVLPVTGTIFAQEMDGNGGCAAFRYYTNQSRRNDTIKSLHLLLEAHMQRDDYDFGSVLFLADAQTKCLQTALSETASAKASAAVSQERVNESCASLRASLQEKDRDIEALKQQIERMRQYQERLENEKEQMRMRDSEELSATKLLLEEKEEDIAYLQRKLDRPSAHEDIPAWVERHFSGRLLLHSRAVGLLQEKSAKSVDVSLICDALDYLATDYWACRYQRISKEEMLSRCSEKYGRPFNVSPTGNMTIEYTPLQYKIKYFIGPSGKPIESAMDYHLSVGNDPENLLRIYFLHDDEKQLIVIGSLPKHLKAVNINV